jgi:hypothetical protein
VWVAKYIYRRIIKRYIFSYNLFYSQIWLDLPNHHRHNFSTSFLSFYGCSLTVASTAQCVCVCVCFFSNNTTQLIVCGEKIKISWKRNTDAACNNKGGIVSEIGNLKECKTDTDTERERERERERAALKELGKSPAIERASKRASELVGQTHWASYYNRKSEWWSGPFFDRESFRLWLDSLSLSLAETLKESLKNECTRYLPISRLVVTYKYLIVVVVVVICRISHLLVTY